jgi:hypothetical protein
MADGGRIEISTGRAPYTAELDGSENYGRANIAGYAARRGYTCGDCGAHGSEPTHTPECWRYYIARRVWAHPAVAGARDWLAGADAMWAESGDAARRPLSDLLRGVLAVIDETAGAS